MASIHTQSDAPRQEIQPAAVYGEAGPIRLRISTGGAGQTGLLRLIAETFIKEYVDFSCVSSMVQLHASYQASLFPSISYGRLSCGFFSIGLL